MLPAGKVGIRHSALKSENVRDSMDLNRKSLGVREYRLSLRAEDRNPKKISILILMGFQRRTLGCRGLTALLLSIYIHNTII